MPEHRDERRCAACGGGCCAIYRPEEEGGGFPGWEWWFPDWVAAWERLFEKSGASASGVGPAYDPVDFYFRLDPARREAAAREILARGGHPDYCQYWRVDRGCALPWDYRPAVCRQYRCREWLEEDAGRHGK